MHCSGSVYPLASAHLDVLALERLLELGSLKFVGIVRWWRAASLIYVGMKMKKTKDLNLTAEQQQVH